LASLPRFPVYFQFFSGPTAAADCAAAGAAGVNSDSWDTYRCVPGSPPFTGQIELLAYVVE
jgi:hypothetical protein